MHETYENRWRSTKSMNIDDNLRKAMKIFENMKIYEIYENARTSRKLYEDL